MKYLMSLKEDAEYRCPIFRYSKDGATMYWRVGDEVRVRDFLTAEIAEIVDDKWSDKIQALREAVVGVRKTSLDVLERSSAIGATLTKAMLGSVRDSQPTRPTARVMGSA